MTPPMRPPAHAHGTSAPPNLGTPISTRDVADVVLVGSGSAGGVLARELSQAGLRVVVLEQGAYLDRSAFVHDDTEVFMRPKYSVNHRQKPNTWRPNAETPAVVRPYLVYGSMVGGGSVHYAANSWRFRPLDFLERTRGATVPGTTVADWPISYDDLEPYYTRAEWELGISGTPGPNDAVRSKPFPMPPLPLTGAGAVLEIAAARLGWTAQAAPMAIASQPYRGRSNCQACGFCWGFGCEYGAKSSTNFTMIPAAVATGRCEIRPGCTAVQVETTAAGRASAVVYRDARGRTVRQRARVVVLAANGAETPRLLLLSANGRHPNGLANASGLVGKNLMLNGNAVVQGEMPQPMNGHKGPPVTRICLDAYDLGASEGIVGGGGFDFRFMGGPMIWSQFFHQLPDLFGASLKQHLATAYSHGILGFAHTSSLPSAANGVDLDPTVKDHLGLPASRVTYTEHEQDMRLMRRVQEMTAQALAAGGATKLVSLPVTADPGGAFHLLGTCRMGHDPATSVVNADHRAHDVPGLYCVDGSSFVSSGRGQPTLTIQALAFRAAERLAGAMKRGEA
jgi:choline dehydrogenase-like flavoprotein